MERLLPVNSVQSPSTRSFRRPDQSSKVEVIGLVSYINVRKRFIDEGRMGWGEAK